MDDVAETDGFVYIVGHENDGFFCFAPNALKIFMKLFFGLSIQRSEWFVHQENVRIEDEHACKRRPLFHASGQLVRIGLFVFRESYHFEICIGFL